MNKKFKKPIKMNFLAFVIMSALSSSAISEEMAYNFSDDFLMGSHAKVDLSNYTSTGIAEGVYSLDVYTNGEWKGRYDLTVDKQKDGKLGLCYSKDMLEQYGIAVDKFNQKVKETLSFCGELNEWNDDTNVSGYFNKNELRLDISVPQIYVNSITKGYVDPAFWDEGINALSVGWNANIYNNHYSSKSGSDTTTGYLGLNSSLMLEGFALNHRGNLSWEKNGETKYNSYQTYLERPIPSIKSDMKVGQVSTTGELFESITLRGVNLKTATSMYPDVMNTFAPEIRGVAQTNALVTVKQGESVIYQTTVSPGPFALTDVYPGGYGNDLLVTVKEADGSESSFTVSYNSGVKLLRPGMFKYELSLGKPDSSSLKTKPVVYQGTVQYGLNNYITAFGGATVFNNYRSLLGGLGLNTAIGGFNFDVTQSKLNGKFTDASGNRLRASYSKSFDSTNTNFTMAAAKFQNKGFKTLDDALLANDGSTSQHSNEKSNISISVNQKLPEKFGSFYLSAKQITYFNNNKKENQYQVSYYNHIDKLNWSVSAQKVKTNSNGYIENDQRISLNMNYPLNFGENNHVTLTSNSLFNNSRHSNTQIGANGTLDGGFSYGINTTLGDNKNVGLNGAYSNRVGNFNASFSQGQDYRQVSLGGNGTMVVHSGGLTLSPETGKTLALIEAKDAKGAKINSALNSEIDGNGYALVSSLRPYKINSVELDPKGASDNVSIGQTMKQVVPWEGRIVKVKFDTKVQDNIFVKGKLSNGSAIPFGTTIYNEQGEQIGLVSQGSVLYISDASSDKGVITVDGKTYTFTMPKDNSKEVICQ